MEELLKLLLDGQKQLFEGQKQLFEGQTRIENRLDILEGKLNENIDITKALRHNNEEINAQLHGLGHNVNALAGKVNKLEEKSDKFDVEWNRLANDVIFLVRKASEHEYDIRQLNRVK